MSKYSCYWIEPGSFTDHVRKVKKSGEWGTQVELQLASDVFQVPVYISAPTLEGIYRWNVFKPKELQIPEEISNKVKPSVYPFCATSDHHIEMAHNSSRIHYDSVKNNGILLSPLLDKNNLYNIELD